MKPLALDLFSGLGGWAEGLEAEGWDVIRVDIKDMFAETNTPKPANCLLMLQDAMTFHGSQAKNCGLIVASPPCTEFSWMAMPWSRAKQVARALRGADEFPQGYGGSRTLEQLTALFDACFRIQREACEAAGRHIPMVVENVQGAQPWVGRSRWNYGSFHLFGDVPLFIPEPRRDATKRPGRTMCFPAGSQNPDTVKGRTGKLHWQDEPDDGVKVPGMNWSGYGKPGYRAVAFNDEAVRQMDDSRKVPGFRFDGSGRSFQTASVEGMKAPAGTRWFNDGPRTPDSLASSSSKSSARKAASAKIAKIPFVLSSYIGRVYHPDFR